MRWHGWLRWLGWELGPSDLSVGDSKKCLVSFSFKKILEVKLLTQSFVNSVRARVFISAQGTATGKGGPAGLVLPSPAVPGEFGNYQI
jgi:hypothetical protein